MPAIKSTNPITTPIDWVTDTIADLPPLATTGETSKALRISTRTLARYCERGLLRAVRVDDSGACHVLIPRLEIERFLRGLA